MSVMISESSVREVLAPVLNWFESDEEAERPLVDILRDVVLELLRDRYSNLAYQKVERDLRSELELSDSYSGPRVDEGGDRAKAKIVEKLKAIREQPRFQ